MRKLKIADNTLLVFSSDNGGLPKIQPGTTGGLRGAQELGLRRGLRVPGIIEWPAVVRPRITNHPACTTDIFPTVAEIVGLDADVFVQPVDGVSLVPVLHEERRCNQTVGLSLRFEGSLDRRPLQALDHGPRAGASSCMTSSPIRASNTTSPCATPAVGQELAAAFLAWNESVEQSFAGHDYPEGRVQPADPAPRHWYEAEEYQPYLPAWRDRWEVKSLSPSARSVVAEVAAPDCEVPAMIEFLMIRQNWLVTMYAAVAFMAIVPAGLSWYYHRRVRRFTGGKRLSAAQRQLAPRHGNVGSNLANAAEMWAVRAVR